MFIKNLSQKVVGFDKLILLPGEVGELPRGYSESHPIVKLWIAKKMIEKTTAPKAEEPKPKKKAKPAKGGSDDNKDAKTEAGSGGGEDSKGAGTGSGDDIANHAS